jgi:hypothetical protein
MNKNNYPVEERNEQLLQIFLKLGYDAKLIGNRNQPKIIIDNSFAISGYVHNKLYHFTDKPFGGVEVRTINLNHEDPISREEVDNLINSSEKRQIWKVGLCEEKSGKTFYYVNTRDKIPYFAFDDCRFFFDKTKAEEAHEYLSGQHGLACFIETQEN